MMGTAAALLVTAIMSLAAGRAYTVEPISAQLSGWTDTLSQTITINFDELDSTTGAYCELFAGTKGAGGAYHVSVLTYPGGSPIASADADGNVDHKWVRFNLRVTHPESVVKGKQLELRFTRAGSDSIQYYWAESLPGSTSRTPYPYGFLKVGGQGDSTKDLCCRVYSRLNAVDSSYWAMVPMDPWGAPGPRLTWKERAKEAGVGAARFEIRWDQVQPGRLDSFDFRGIDSELSFLMDSARCGVFAMLNYCAESASSRVDTSRSGVPYRSINCAPRGLFSPVSSDSNLWARFVERTVMHLDSVGHSVHAYEVMNEVNDTCVVESLHGYPHWVTGWWRRPNLDYLTGFDGLRGLCSLYVRLCEVAASVIETIPGHQGDTILVGSMAGVTSEGTWLASGKTWLRTMYDIAGGSVFWNDVSVHPYQWQGEFDPEFYAQNAETLRAIMRQHGDVGQLWNTEIGWDTADGSWAAQERNARSLCKTFVSSKASEVWPGGGYDRACWWLFRETGPRCGHFPLLSATMETLYASFHAFKQMTRALTGKRFNRRVMQGDGKDDSVRVYEFEDPATLRRTWVCWKNGGTDSAARVEVRIPVMSDRITAESLAYRDGKPPGLAVRPGIDGWLSLSLNERPVFISEQDVPKRPDLVVDSVRVAPVNPKVGESLTVRAWVRNQGTRATPRGYAIRVLFAANGDSIGGAEVSKGLAAGQTVPSEFLLSQVPVGMSGPVLFAATVNPGQRYVEFDIDNNTGYTQAVIE